MTLPRTALSRRPRRRAMPAWWFTSVALHALAFASLLLFTAAGRDLLERIRERSAIPEMNSDRMEELSEHLQELNELELQSRLAELQEIQQELETIRDETFEEFEQYAASQAEGAADAVAQAQAEARTAQQAATAEEAQSQQAQDAAADAARRAAASAGDASTKAQQQTREAQQKSREAQDRAKPAQGTAESAMERAVRAMGWVGATAPQDAQEKAFEEQAKARSEHAAAELAHEKARAAESATTRARERIASEEKKVQERTAKAAAEEAKRPDAQKKVAETIAALEAAKAEAAKRKEALARATQQTAAARTEAQKQPRNSDARKAAEARAKAADESRRLAEAESRKAGGEVRKLERAQRDARSQLSRLESQIQRAQTEAQKTRDAKAAREKELKEKLDALAKDQDASRRAQADASAAQKRANAAHEEAIRAMAKWLQETGQLNPAPMPETASARTVSWAEMKKLDAYDLYRRAVEAETAVAETYKAIRAAELGMLRKMPLKEALKNTDVAKPVRPEMDRKALTDAARTAAALEKHKAAMKEAVGEADKMVELARSMHEAAADLKRSGAEGLSVQVAHASAMEKAAAENPDQKSVDLTGLMARRAGGGGGDSDQSRPSAARGNPGRADRSRTHPPLERNTPGVLPGRMIASDGREASWMYVDSWYLIGPWPNPGRMNIDKKFPPETVVDLDATYIGRGGQPLRWRYVKSPKAEFVPPNAPEYVIYYAYTEVFCEEALDVWMAIGSDDKSKIWLNDQVIWESVPWHKPWHINEGFRKVRLQKGRNRILYRLENGWHGCALSLVICTQRGQ